MTLYVSSFPVSSWEKDRCIAWERDAEGKPRVPGGLVLPTASSFRAGWAAGGQCGRIRPLVTDTHTHLALFTASPQTPEDTDLDGVERRLERETFTVVKGLELVSKDSTNENRGKTK